MYKIFKNCTLVHSASLNQLEFQHKKTIIVDKKNGKILKIQDNNDSIENYADHDLTYLTCNQILIPGFIDTHTHAPQFSFKGTGMDLSLLDWLNKYTFPSEAKFSDLEYAKKIYIESVNTHLLSGTTTICYYGTIHLEATILLADIIEKTGMRGYVGKVCMDQNAPDFYIEKSAQESLKDTEKFIKHIKDKHFKNVTPILTPRFAVTCSSDLMKGLSLLSDEYDLPIQTHLSENKAEIEFVQKLFPECKNYTDVYFKYGLLRKNSIMAHCIHLNDSEIDLIKQTQAGISHCPNSNTTLHSGIMPLRKYLDKNLKIGLGTDVAGGYSSSILDAIKSSIGSSKILYSILDNTKKPISFVEAFYLATCGGAQLLGLENKIGKFTPGMEFDALLIDFSNLFMKNNGDYFLEENFEKIIYLIDDRNIKQIYVKGELIEKFNQ